MLFENLSKVGDGISALQNVGKIHDIIQDYSKIDEIINIVDGLSESNVQLLLNYDKIDDVTKGIIISTSKYTDSLVLSSAAEKAANTSTFSLSSAYQGLAAKIGISTTALGLWTAAIAAIGIAYVAISSYNQHQEELAQAARESAEAYSSASASIDEYTQKYKALHEELTSANTTEERQYEIKKELLALQTELNDKYGDEYGRVNLVTGAYKEQTDALMGLNKALANDYLNNTPGLGMAEEEMTKERTYSLGSTGNLLDQSGQDILSVVSKYEDKGIELTEFDPLYGVKGYNIEFRGDASQAKEVLNELASELRQLQDTYKDNNFIDSLLNSSTSSLQKNSKILTTYEQQYNQMLISQIAISDNLSGGYQQAVDAVQNYNDLTFRTMQNPGPQI